MESNSESYSVKSNRGLSNLKYPPKREKSTDFENVVSEKMTNGGINK
jgi:hypothetical protein